MIKVVSFKICPFVQRVTAALAAKQVPYEIEYISLKDKPQWFLDLAPNGQVPVLITESGTALFESDAIIEYIEDEFGPLEEGVTNEQRALDRAWSYLGSKNYLTQCGTMGSKDKATFEERVAKFITAFAKVEAQLSGEAKFFKSDVLSNVDIAWLPLLHRAAIIKKHTDFDFLCGLPKVQAWQSALLETGLAEKTISDDFEQLFTDFYLSDTYLGTGKDVQQSSACSSSSCCS
ncbi:glutathione S-transferase family protein [Photobacterium sp. SDRW27]|uniref:glutathione S-transferase family protein n=1 Tax=Photobacterium obscurum TaxID=2829490 RepID=UPI0022447671|nr:glutathione S-transferase family protein [Photobacterium obscurum]MCW8328947.1 glutathione S-transferase family protein [Photobacterium obscurum]